MLRFRNRRMLPKYILFSPFSTLKLKEEKVKISSWEINYVKVGRGPHPVLCIPGALSTVSSFRPQIEGFDRDKFTLVVWDPPGYGKSRPPDREFNINAYEKEAVCALEFMKALQIPRYSIMGWSDGGISGMIHAAKHPEKMIKLVLVATRSFVLPQEIKIIGEWKERIKTSMKLNKCLKHVYGDSYYEYFNKWLALYEFIARDYDGKICAHLLKDIKCPTFILHGEKDNDIYPEQAFELSAKVSNARLHLYPDGRHNIHIQYANDFNKRVQDFLLEI